MFDQSSHSRKLSHLSTKYTVLLSTSQTGNAQLTTSAPSQSQPKYRISQSKQRKHTTPKYQHNKHGVFHGCGSSDQESGCVVAQITSSIEESNGCFGRREGREGSVEGSEEGCNEVEWGFALWSLCQTEEWQPLTLWVIHQRHHSEAPRNQVNGDMEDTIFWPGNVYTYYDLFVVAVWDIYRKARLKLLQVAADCSNVLASLPCPRDANCRKRCKIWLMGCVCRFHFILFIIESLGLEFRRWRGILIARGRGLR